MLTGALEKADKYRATGDDLLVVPELIATNELFTCHKNLLEVCRHYHNNRQFDADTLDNLLDNLLDVVLALFVLTGERNA